MCIIVKSYSILPGRLQFIMKKSFVPTLFKVSVEHLLILKTLSLSLEKEIIVLEKISKIVSPKICTNPVEQTCN